MNQIRRTSNLAIVSLVCGVLGWTLAPFLGSIIAVITGHMARAEIRRSAGPSTATAWRWPAWCWAGSRWG
jgi:hypothetical protein